MDADAAVRELGVDFSRDLVTAEMKAGDVLLFNNHLPHRSVGDCRAAVCGCWVGCSSWRTDCWHCCCHLDP